jgi:hypothetical protein
MLQQLKLRPLFGLMIIGASWLMAGCGEDKPATPASTPAPSAGGGGGGPATPDKDATKAP